MNKRTYSKEEIASLLERAAELHAQEAKSTNDKPGLTLAEIEEVAAESGIDPLLVRQAATEMSGAPRISHLQVRDTTATHNTVERIIPGTLQPDVWADIVLELRHRYDSSFGKMMGAQDSTHEQIGRSVQWSHMTSSGIETKVLIRPRGNKMHLTLSQRVGWGGSIAESVTYGTVLAFLVGTFSGAPLDSALIGGIATFATLAIAIPLIYWLDQAWRKKMHRQLDALADRISNMLILSESDAEGAETISLEEYSEGRIDESLLESDEDTLEQSEAQPEKSKVKNT